MAKDEEIFEDIDPNSELDWASARRFERIIEDGAEQEDETEPVKAIQMTRNVQFEIDGHLVQIFSGDYIILELDGGLSLQVEEDFEMHYRLTKGDALDDEIQQALSNIDPSLEDEIDDLFGDDYAGDDFGVCDDDQDPSDDLEGLDI